MKRRLILSSILTTVPLTSVGVLTTEAKAHRPGLMRLTAGGPSHSVMLSGAETPDKGFDVSPASALHNLLSVRRARRHGKCIANLVIRALGILQGSTEKSLAGEHRAARWLSVKPCAESGERFLPWLTSIAGCNSLSAQEKG
jgi:hypothetical protein